MNRARTAEDLLEEAFFAHHGRTRQTEAQWRGLEKMAYVDATTKAGTPSERLPYLNATMHEMLHLASQMLGRVTPPGKPSAQEANIEVRLSDREGLRAGAVRDGLAGFAATQSPVRTFRQQVLNGFRSPEAARAFVRSPVAAMLSRDEVRRYGVPPVDHTWNDAQWVETTVGKSWRRSAWVDPPGRRLEKEFIGPPGTLDVLPRLAVPVFPAPDGSVASADLPQEPLDWHESDPIWPNPLLDELVTIAHWLAERLPWSERAAAWFVLTAMPPHPSPVRVEARIAEADYRAAGKPHTYTRATITLEIEPWVTEQTVTTAYRSLQRQMLGQDNREHQEKSLAAFCFVPEQRARGDGNRTWYDRMMAWNQSCPHAEWRFSDVDHFRKTVRRVERNVLSFPYQLPTATSDIGDG